MSRISVMSHYFILSAFTWIICIIYPLGSVNVFGGNATSAEIDGLQGQTTYAISVAGLTVDEELEKVGLVIVDTCKSSFKLENYRLIVISI